MSNFKDVFGHWLLARARRHEVAALRLKARAEKLFRAIKGARN